MEEDEEASETKPSLKNESAKDIFSHRRSGKDKLQISEANKPEQRSHGNPSVRPNRSRQSRPSIRESESEDSIGSDTLDRKRSSWLNPLTYLKKKERFTVSDANTDSDDEPPKNERGRFSLTTRKSSKEPGPKEREPVKEEKSFSFLTHPSKPSGETQPAELEKKILSRELDSEDGQKAQPGESAKKESFSFNPLTYIRRLSKEQSEQVGEKPQLSEDEFERTRSFSPPFTYVKRLSKKPESDDEEKAQPEGSAKKEMSFNPLTYIRRLSKEREEELQPSEESSRKKSSLYFNPFAHLRKASKEPDTGESLETEKSSSFSTLPSLRKTPTSSQESLLGESQIEDEENTVYPRLESIAEEPPGNIQEENPEKRRQTVIETLQFRRPTLPPAELTKLDIAVCFFPEEPDWLDESFTMVTSPPFASRDTFDSSNLFPRGYWETRMKYLLAMLAFSIKFANIHHFPCLVHRFGGLPFLVPYTVLTFFVGYPLHFIQCFMGQYSRQGIVGVWNMAPIGRGVGVAMFMLCLIISCYYNTYSALSLIYFSRCFSRILPWQQCPIDNNLPDVNQTCIPRLCMRTNSLHYAPTEFYFYFSLDPTEPTLRYGIDKLAWNLLFAFFLAWLAVYFITLQGVYSIGKVVVLFVALPYFMLFMLLMSGLLMEGSLEGLTVMWTKNATTLLDIQVWRIAAEHVFFELGLSYGCPIVYGSYCLHRNTIRKDSAIICFVNYFTSILCATIVFLILGTLSAELHTPVLSIFRNGPGHVFIVYPEGFSRLKGYNTWCVVFFVVVFMAVINSLMTMLECIFTVVYDRFPSLRPYRWLINFIICGCIFLLGISLCSYNGDLAVFILHRMSGSMPGLVILEFMLLGIVVYGCGRFCKDVRYMFKFSPNLYIRFCFFAIPILLLSLIVMSSIFRGTISAIKHPYIEQAIYVGWFLYAVVLLWIPFGVFYWVFYCCLRGEARNIFRPSDSWSPPKIQEISI